MKNHNFYNPTHSPVLLEYTYDELFRILVQYKMYINAQKIFGQVRFLLYISYNIFFSQQHSFVIFASILMK